MACDQLCEGAGGGWGVRGLRLRQAAITLGNRSRKRVGLLGRVIWGNGLNAVETASGKA